jgi:hypothetical protein
MRIARIVPWPTLPLTQLAAFTPPAAPDSDTDRTPLDRSR